jgi:hypothetical protein
MPEHREYLQISRAMPDTNSAGAFPGIRCLSRVCRYTLEYVFGRKP